MTKVMAAMLEELERLCIQYPDTLTAIEINVKGDGSSTASIFHPKCSQRRAAIMLHTNCRCVMCRTKHPKVTDPQES